MHQPLSSDENAGGRPLEGQRAWVISDGKAGHEVQCLGVAEALGVKVDVKRVSPHGLRRLLSPWGGISRGENFGKEGSQFAPPCPAIAFATGRLTTPYIRELKRRAGNSTYTVILLDPKTGTNSADLFWVPEHDTRRGANVFTTLTSPHRFSPARLQELRKTCPADIAVLPRPRIAVLVGGPNGDYRYTSDDEARLVNALHAIAKCGAGLMITPSRRTPANLIEAIDSATRGAARVFWNGTGDNPYASFLAYADAFLVTADSVNMAGEAAATGKPIYVFYPSGGSKKFERYHRALEANGITRRLPETNQIGLDWSYPPIDSASIIAREIERRWTAHQAACGAAGVKKV